MARLPLRRERDPEGRMPVMDHLRELRRRVIIIVIIVALGAVIGWIIYNPVLSFIKGPYCNVPPKYRFNPGGNGKSCDLVTLAPLDGFTLRLKVSVIIGAIFTAPFWLYQVWAFITPGLRKNERKYTIVFVVVSTLLFAAGVTLAYIMLDHGLRIIIEQGGDQVRNFMTAQNYLSFVQLFLVVFGAAFELPLIIAMANIVGVLPYRILRRAQRISIFAIFVFSGIATPTTDPFTMSAMAAAMVILFEASVLFCYVHDRRKAHRQAEENEQLDDDQPSTINPIPERLDSADDHWSNLP